MRTVRSFAHATLLSKRAAETRPISSARLRACLRPGSTEAPVAGPLLLFWNLSRGYAHYKRLGTVPGHHKLRRGRGEGVATKPGMMNRARSSIERTVNWRTRCTTAV